MDLCFPDFDSLRLALTSGAVPPAVSAAPVRAGFADDGRVWVRPSAPLPRHALAGLRRLGASLGKADVDVGAEFSCWPQLLPLQRDPAMPLPNDQTPVLFELPDPGQLPTVVSEILRLGNDRQGFRWFGDGGDGPALLRVIGPPYYSLLRALDRDGHTAAPRAYTERGPRVWVQVGHTHPLVEQIRSPDGQLVLLRPPRDWLTLPDAPFRDIYEVLEFPLAAAPMPWQERELAQRLPVPLCLAPGGSGEPAELWILREHALEQLDELVQGADDSLLARLAFAVAQGGAQTVIALRVRPSRQPPPVLVLEAQGYRPYLKLANLFLPCGSRLHPPLRRDAVRRLLAEDVDRLTWLHPHRDGTFTPESLPENAFQPLAHWIDYVLDHDRVALEAWVQSTQFDFEPFICRDEHEPSTRPRKAPVRKRPAVPPKTEMPAGNEPIAKSPEQTRQKLPANSEIDGLETLPRPEPGELQRRLYAVEQQFLELEGPLDAPERPALWAELAALNAALGHASDATACWVNALWEDGDHAAERARRWACAEGQDNADRLSGAELETLLATGQPSPSAVRRLAAHLVWSAHHEPSKPALVKCLGALQHFLAGHEDLLPVRAVWLAWQALARLAHGDVLALARARDRLLERLFKYGLSPELDLPGFLRFSGNHDNERLRAFRGWLATLPERVRRWIHQTHNNTEANPGDTEAYANLILAFGLARLGEIGQAADLRNRARTLLDGRGDSEADVHHFLREAFEYRIAQALEGKPLAGPLPPEQLEYLDILAREDAGQQGRTRRYKADRLRQHSRILEPHETINPFRQWHERFYDALGKELVAVADISDPVKLGATIEQLLHQAGTEQHAAARQARILTAALAVAPRAGETLSRKLLAEVGAVYEGLPDALQQAALLERALFVAAHFDQAGHVQELLGRFHTLLQAQRGAGNVTALESLAGQCFRGLRKLGMRDEIYTLLRELTDAIMNGETMDVLRARPDWPHLLRTLLHVAAGWYYFGKDDQARPVMDEARALLFQGQLAGRAQALLAGTYAATLGQAPVEFVLPALEELFQKLDRVNDTYTTNSHYSLSRLEVIEAVVLAVATEDFAMGPTARRWLDDDEFLVRRRIHRDLHAALGNAPL